MIFKNLFSANKLCQTDEQAALLKLNLKKKYFLKMFTVSFKLLILTIDSKFLELKNKKEIRLIKYTF